MSEKKRIWFCLDVDFYLDEKLETLTDERGEEWGYRYLKLVSLVLTRGSGGWLRPEKRFQWSAVRKQMGFTAEVFGDGADDAFRDFLDTLSIYELIDPGMWSENCHVTSKRMQYEWERIDKRQSRAAAGGNAKAANKKKGSA